MTKRIRARSRICKATLALLGKQIKVARKRRGFSEQELARRVGVCRQTIRKIESGSPSVEVGILVEAAAIVGVWLFSPEGRPLDEQIRHQDELLALLPKRAVRHTATVI